MPSFSQTTEILAVYGAVLSTLLAIWQVVKDLRKVKVVVDFSVFVDSYDGENSTISIRAINVGHRPIEVISAGFMFEDDSEFFQLKSSLDNDPLPCRLGDGESVNITYDLNDFQGIMFGKGYKELHLRKAFVRDAEKHRYSVRLSKEEKELLDGATMKFLEKEGRQHKL